jgi:hypothetical protein
MFIRLCLIISFFLGQGAALAASESLQPGRPVQPAGPEKAAKVNPLTNALGQAGVVHCQGRIQQVADFLSTGMNSGATLLLPPDHINDHLVSASMEVFDGNAMFYANMDFAPLVAYGCDATYETVVYWPNSCDVVAKTQFKQAKKAGKMRQFIQALSFGDSLQIFLMPAGAGCVSIKKQALFDQF